MALILNEKYSSNSLFYTNRFLRLYPLYLLFLIGSVAWFLFTWVYIGYRPPPFWIADALDKIPLWQRFALAISNLTMIGLDVPSLLHFRNGAFEFLPYGGGTELTDGYWGGWIPALPQAWSLGVEIWFYLLAPALVRRAVSLQLLIAGASASIFLLMNNAYPLKLTSLFPANLCYFMIGSVLYQFYRSRFFKPLSGLTLWLSISAASACLLWVGNIQGAWISVLGLFLVACTFPYLFEATKDWRVDTFIGNLSYPIYLCHVLVTAVLMATIRADMIYLLQPSALRFPSPR